MSLLSATAIDPWDGVHVALLLVGRFTPKKSWTMEAYTNPNDDLFLIERGYGWSECDGRRIDARPGDLFIWRRGRHYNFAHDPARPMTLYNVSFHLRGAGSGDVLRPYALPDRIRLPRKAWAAVRRCFDAVVRPHGHKRSPGTLASRGAFLILLSETLRLVKTLPAARQIWSVTAPPGELTRAAGVQAYINKNIGRPLTLKELAGVAHLSRYYFAALFRRHTGQSPMAYVRRRRIEIARALLLSSDNTVEQVARAVGFDDPFHFSRVFRRSAGVPPSAYRAAQKNPFLQ